MPASNPPNTVHPILPHPGKRNILITSALPYVNNIPHLGNIIGAPLSADVSSRYWKARGVSCLYICGTDEYGTATETKAIEEKTTPKALCAKYHAVHKAVYEWIGIEFDYFGRSSTDAQTEIVQDIFLKLQKNGYIEERTDKHPYCANENHKRFLADRFVEGDCPVCKGKNGRGDQCDDCGALLNPEDLINPRCKLDGEKPVLRETRHLYLKLDKLQPQIEEWLEKFKSSWSTNGIAITDDWIKKGLLGRAITRDLSWGVPVPVDGYEKKVFYVWFDACIGYVSITANYTNQWEKWWRDPENVQLYQFMGKDNVPFHTVIFPGSQIGTEDKWTKLHHLSTTEYLKYEGGKFSKSRNIGVFGTNAQDTGVPPDVWRYFLLKRRPETGDTEFEWIEFIRALNGELVANLGNFVNRILKFSCNPKFYNGVVPPYEYSKYDNNKLKIKIDEINASLKKYNEQMEAVSQRAAVGTFMEISAAGNEWLQANTIDGRLFMDHKETCDIVVGLALNVVHLLASIIRPFLPVTSDSIVKQLGLPAEGAPYIPDTFDVDAIKPGHKLATPELLFTPIIKVEEQAAAWKDQFGGKEAQKEKEAQAAKKAAEKERKKAKKAASKAGSTLAENSKTSNAVQSANKIEAKKIDEADTTVDEVKDKLHEAALHSS